MKDKINNIVKNIYSYNDFVCEMEIYYSHLESWLNLEILNSLALEEWESFGKPTAWEDWGYKYKEQAIDLLIKFLYETKSLNHK